MADAVLHVRVPAELARAQVEDLHVPVVVAGAHAALGVVVRVPGPRRPSLNAFQECVLCFAGVPVELTCL